MKIYVDEMPVQIRQRIIHYDDGKTNCVELEFAENVKPTEICTTQSLKQQVRAEVVEEIRKQLKDMDFLANDTEPGERFSCYSKYKVLDVLLKVERNQVKGESNVKD